jgi:hypothetical protein
VIEWESVGEDWPLCTLELRRDLLLVLTGYIVAAVEVVLIPELASNYRVQFSHRSWGFPNSLHGDVNLRGFGVLKLSAKAQH